jgi:hypothetical protein
MFSKLLGYVRTFRPNSTDSFQKENLERDLYLYLPGLAPVLAFASLTVRPIFGKLLETYVLPLDPPALRSPLKAIILALLPGLEDESSEDYDMWIEMLNKFRKASCSSLGGDDISEAQEIASDSYFWQCFFLATITNPSRRQGALAYLVRELPKFKESADSKINSATMSPEAKATLAPEPGLLIRCLASGLSDEQSLVQRGFLDLLVAQLPLDSVVLQKVVPVADLDRLIYAAIGVVGRRDMSLNRRLWSWLLGPESNEDAERSISSPSIKSPNESAPTQANYFARHGLRSLARTLNTMFVNNTTSLERSKPFRLCLSLMDRWEVGGLLIPDIFVPALRNAYEISEQAKKNEAEDVVKSASNFFDGIESGLIWTKFNQLVSTGLTESRNTSDLSLCLFIITRFNIREEEMITRHIPLSSLFLLTHLSKSSVSDDARVVSLDILERLVGMVPSRSFSMQTGEKIRSPTSVSRSEIAQSILTYYTDHHGGLDGAAPPYSPVFVGQVLLRESLGLLLSLFKSSPTSPAIDSLTRAVCGLMQRISDSHQIISQLAVFDSLNELLDSSSTKLVHFRVLAATTAFLVSYNATSKSAHLSTALQNLVIHHLWQHLRLYNPKFHVETVRCLWQIEEIAPSKKIVEAAITSFIASSLEHSTSADVARQFVVFWIHSTQDRQLPAEKGQKGSMRRVSSAIGGLGQSVIPPDPSNVLSRPLIFLLDHLNDEGTEIASFLKSWIQDSPSLSRVFHILISKIQSLSCINSVVNDKKTENGNSKPTTKRRPTLTQRSAGYDDSKECLYYMKHLLNIFRLSSEHTWIVAAGETSENVFKDEKPVTLQAEIVQLVSRALDVRSSAGSPVHITDLHRVSLEVILVVLQNQFASPLKSFDLENVLLKRLHSQIGTMHHLLQAPMLECIAAAMKLKASTLAVLQPHPLSPGFRKLSRDVLSMPPKGASSLAPPSRESLAPPQDKLQPPKHLIECLKLGFQTKSSRLVIDSWVTFLVDILPLVADSVLENLIPLVECLCSQIALAFGQLRSIYQRSVAHDQPPPEAFLLGLLNALENLLANAHDQLVGEETKSQAPKSPEQQSSFFGTMALGVFSGDSSTNLPGRQATANSRLTVLLCFQDAVRACFTIWSWGIYENAATSASSASAAVEKPDPASIASYSYTAVRVRNRARRLLEHLFAAEALECMETVASLWCRPESDEFKPLSVLAVLNVLNGSRPRHTIPAIFNAIYSRTNPSALEPFRQSSLSSELVEGDLVNFLLAYSRTIDDDAMDEIWTDCMTFVRDVLSNPLPHSQILPSLLVFLAILAEKTEGTNFGEQRKTRRELGDLFLRLLAATFTTKPAILLDVTSDAGKKGQKGGQGGSGAGLDLFTALVQVIPQLKLILPEQDRLQSAINSVTANVTGPSIRARSFPSNIDSRVTRVLEQLTRIPQAGRLWKKDVTDAFTDSKFFSMSLASINSGWLRILQEYVSGGADPEHRFAELISRINSPTTAGIVFGVGATAARAQEDGRTGGTLRRLALLLLACPEDSFAKNVPGLVAKLTELLSASATSSPSSGTRADVYLVVRALVLRINGVLLGSLWSVVNGDLISALVSVLPKEENDNTGETYNNAAVVGACKLLDALVCLQGDEWQLHEWLFVTDTIDAVYAPPRTASRPVAVVDAIAEGLGNIAVKNDSDESDEDGGEVRKKEARTVSTHLTASKNGLRRLILPSIFENANLDLADLRAMQKETLAVRVLRPFFGQLSLMSFEATYGMMRPDEQQCADLLLGDLFEGGGDFS